jgi:arsenate reductase (glutaredoxin)
MSITLHGIPNCDTVKKARTWLDARGVAYTFWDFKKQGAPDALDAWMREVGWEAVLNKRGTSWRALDAAAQAAVIDAASAAAAARANLSLLKRPVVVWADGAVTVGFDEAVWCLKTANL